MGGCHAWGGGVGGGKEEESTTGVQTVSAGVPCAQQEGRKPHPAAQDCQEKRCVCGGGEGEHVCTVQIHVIACLSIYIYICVCVFCSQICPFTYVGD